VLPTRQTGPLGQMEGGMMELRPRRLIWLQRQRGVDRSIGAVSRVAYSGGTSSPKFIATGEARTQGNGSCAD
jgi:hypothetical protein